MDRLWRIRDPVENESGQGETCQTCMKKPSWKWVVSLVSCSADATWIRNKTSSQDLPEFLTPRSLGKIKPVFQVIDLRVRLLSSNDYQNNVVAWALYLALLSLSTVFSKSPWLLNLQSSSANIVITLAIKGWKTNY